MLLDHFVGCSKYLRVVLACYVIAACASLPQVIKIGGIFDIYDDELELAFRYAIDRINTDNSILPRSKLLPLVRRLAPGDSFRATKMACELLEQGVSVIFSPLSTALSTTIQSTCHAFEVPCIYQGRDLRLRINHHSINLYPDSISVVKAIKEVVLFKKWDKFTLIYQNNEDIIRYLDLLSDASISNQKITLRQLTEEETYKSVLKEAKKNGESNIVLDIPTTALTQLLQDAFDVGMLTDYHNYLITSLDFHILDVMELKSVSSNITAFRLVDPSRHQVTSVIKDWVFGELRYGRPAKATHILKTDVALLYDGISLFSQALQDLDRSQPIQIYPISCSVPEVTSYGKSVVSYMKMIHIDGLTGNIEFSEEGRRHDVAFDIIELHRGTVTKVGTWDTKTGVNYNWDRYSDHGNDTLVLRNKTLRVTTIVVSVIRAEPYGGEIDANPPFVIKETKRSLDGISLKGYCIDLLKEISRIYGFTYKISLVQDNRYGSRDNLGEWNGLIQQLINREADIAVADLTITSERQDVVDFTMPFMVFGISILMKHPLKEVAHWFTFFVPLSAEVWIAIASAYIVVTLVLYAVARLTPFEWIRNRKNETRRKTLENQFTLSTSFWFTVSSFTQQGSNIAPRAISTRVLASIWWFFALITLSSYTANLAAFLTAQRMVLPIQTAEDLEKQSTIKYGCVEDGATAMFFKACDIPVYKRMWTTMISSPSSVFSKSNEEGVKRVLKENYAFFMESPVIEYMKQRHCGLVQTGGILDSKGYGLAMPPGSPFRQLFSNAVLMLKENGFLEKLKKKWWKIKGGRTCQHTYSVQGLSPLALTISRTGGLFILLIVGIGLSCIVFAIEYFCRKGAQPRQRHRVQCHESHL